MRVEYLLNWTKGAESNIAFHNDLLSRWLSIQVNNEWTTGKKGNRHRMHNSIYCFQRETIVVCLLLPIYIQCVCFIYTLRLSNRLIIKYSITFSQTFITQLIIQFPRATIIILSLAIIENELFFFFASFTFNFNVFQFLLFNRLSIINYQLIMINY